jgi:hypothetical protein
MTIKQAYYYSCSIHEVSTNRNVTKDIKSIFDDVFKKECIDNGGIKTMSLNSEKATLDIIYEDNTYLFARVGKAKDQSDALIRDQKTMKYKYVIENKDLGSKYLEICTYFLLDYSTGIVGFILGKSAPTVSTLINIVNLHYQEYIMTIDNIVSAEHVKALMSPGSTIGKIKYSFAVPNVDILKYIGLKPKQIAALTDTEVFDLDLVIRNKPRKSITSDNRKIRAIIGSFEELPEQIKKTLSFTGKTSTSSTQDYDFDVQNMVYSITVPTEKIVDSKKKKLSIDEVASDVFIKLRNLYISNKKDLIRFCNREES